MDFYLIGEINYGGRVTDDLDRRCLMSNLRHYYDPHVLEDNYKFTSSGIYISPPEGKHAEYVEYILSLPSSEGPDVFGMHENALITFQLQESNKISNVVLSIQPRASASAGGKSPDEVVAELASSIQQSLSPPLNPLEIAEVEPILGPNGQMSSLMVVLFQVRHSYLHLTSTLHMVGGNWGDLRQNFSL